MTARAIVLLRHGQTDYNKAMRMQGQIDIPLNKLGQEQAAEAASVLSAVPISRIVSSDLSRAQDTALVLAEQTGVSVETDPRLRERSFGQWEGLTREELEGQYPSEYAQWRGGKDPEGVGVESRADTAARMGQIIREVGEDAPDGAVVVLVAHGAAIALGIADALGLGPQWHGLGGMGNCHWSVLAPNPGREPFWRLGAHNVGVDLVPNPRISTFEKSIRETREQRATSASGRVTRTDATGIPKE